MKRATALLLSMFLILVVFSSSVLAAGEGKNSVEKIVFLSDLSGSVVKLNQSESFQDAISLAIRLAPDRTLASVMGVNTEIAVETPLMELESPEQRGELLAALGQFTYTGNTNLVYGLQKAVEKLEGSGRIVMFADLSEGGLIPSTAQTLAEWTEQARLLAEECPKNGVVVDMILIGETPKDSALAAAIEQIATASGGKVLRPETAAELTGCVEEILFSAYPYFLQTLTTINSSTEMQTLPVSMPTNHLKRARVYVPSSVGIQASYAGAGLETQKKPTYSLLDLERPARDGLTLSILPSERETTVYLISDYRLIGRTEVASELIAPQEKDGEYRQQTTVTLDVLDVQSAQSILDEKTSALFSAELTLTAPDGTTQTMQAAPLADGRYQVSFEPVYGDYTISATLSSGESALPPVTSTFEVADIRPVEEAWTLTMTLAAIIGGLLLLAAILFAVHQRKKANYQSAVQTMDRNRFTGRLQVATVIAEGGNQEIPPFVFQLDRVREETKLSLAQLYEASGVSYQVPQGDKILFLPGPGESVVVKNNAACKILAAGREYGTREKIQIHYDQKVYIVFEENENELEIYYRPTRDHSYSSKKLAVSTKA